MRVAFATAVLVLPLVAAACGGKSNPGVAAIGTTATTSTTTTAAASSGATSAATNALLAKLVRFSGCMRTHGVAQFPDPTSRNGGVRLLIGPGSGIDPTSASFKRAQKACASLLPTKAEIASAVASAIQQRLPGMLNFSKCMRRHGVTGFPDPSAQQGLTLQMVEAAGVDVQSQKVIDTAQTCLPAADGAITEAQLKQVEQQATSGGSGAGG
jgi:hypothetical protein